MGKGTIISGGTGGQYQVEINYDRGAYTDAIERIDEQIVALEEEKAILEEEDYA